MRRFIFSPNQQNGQNVLLDHAESMHIEKVLRLGNGEMIELVDGSGTVYSAEIIRCGDQIEVKILESRVAKENDDGEIWLSQGIVKPKNMELLLQKCTELGVARFTPMISKRCQGNLVTHAKKKRERWQKIIDEACKQSHRVKPMVLDQVTIMEEVLSMTQGHQEVVKLLFWEKETSANLADIPRIHSPNTIFQLIVGPEGGFSEEEVETISQQGFQTISLGNRVLRAETGAIAAVAIIQHILGNM